MTIEEMYNERATTPSDINEHLPILKEAASKCDHVTEFGVRWPTSTWALLAGKPKKMVSYDIQRPTNIEIVEQMAKDEGIEFQFIQSNVLTIDIEPTDMLLIDTLHTYKQLKAELARHANKVAKWILIHDTETFGRRDMEDVYHVDTNMQPEPSIGMKPAIEQFITDNPSWKLLHHFKNNNGLTILKHENPVSSKT